MGIFKTYANKHAVKTYEKIISKYEQMHIKHANKMSHLLDAEAKEIQLSGETEHTDKMNHLLDEMFAAEAELSDEFLQLRGEMIELKDKLFIPQDEENE